MNEASTLMRTAEGMKLAISSAKGSSGNNRFARLV